MNYYTHAKTLESSHITLNMNKEKMLDGDKEPIYLIYQYFLPKTEKRRKEVQEALTRNIANTHISKISENVTDETITQH